MRAPVGVSRRQTSVWIAAERAVPQKIPGPLGCRTLRWSLLDGDLVAQALQVAHGVAGSLLASAFVEVVGAEVSVDGAIAEHVVNGHQQGVGYRDQGTFLAPASAQAPIQSPVVAVRVLADVERGLDHEVPDGSTRAGGSRAFLATAMGVAR